MEGIGKIIKSMPTMNGSAEKSINPDMHGAIRKGYTESQGICAWCGTELPPYKEWKYVLCPKCEQVTITELKGNLLKKALNIKTAVKRYHNKHKDGSGNFGFTICTQDKWFSLDGDYNTTGAIYKLSFGPFSSLGSRITTSDYQAMIDEMKIIIDTEA